MTTQADKPNRPNPSAEQAASDEKKETSLIRVGHEKKEVLEERMQQVMDLISSYMMANMLMKASALKDKDLGYSHFATLMLIDRWGVTTIKDIAGLLHMELPTASRVIDKLVGLGYVERTEGTVDRRYKEVRVTEDGKELLQSMGEIRRTAIRSIVKNLSEESITNYIKLLEALVQELSTQDLLPGLLKSKRCGAVAQTPSLLEQSVLER